MRIFCIWFCPASLTRTLLCSSIHTLVRQACFHVWILSKPSTSVFWQPLSADDLDEVVKLARKVTEKTFNLHAVYHQTDGDTAAAIQQVPIFIATSLLDVVTHLSSYIFIDLLQDEIKKMCSSTLQFTWLQGAPASESLLHMVHHTRTHTSAKNSMKHKQ